MSSKLVQLPAGTAPATAPECIIPAKAARLRMLRLSVTDLCNFRCCYCMPPEGVAHKLRRDQILALEEMAQLVHWLTRHAGVERIRLTGGEPLIRPGIEHLIRQLASIPGIREVAVTTNASLLAPKAETLKAAGLKRLNISLDSIDEARFREITRGGSLARTLEGIRVAKAIGLTPIKINSVLQRSSWQREVPRLLDYAAEQGFEIRFIELMRTGTEAGWCEAEYISVDEVRQGLGTTVEPVATQDHSPAQRTRLDWHGAPLTVGWITPRSHPFCSRCERLRMDAQGNLRRCLMDATTLNLYQLVQNNDETALFAQFYTYVAGKMPPREMASLTAMCQIGG